MHTTKVRMGRAVVRDVRDPTFKHDVLTLLHRAGYHYPASGILASPGVRVTRHLYKLWSVFSTERARTCDASRGIPIVLVMLRVRGEPWCVLVTRRARDQRMILTRYAFTDDALFDGTLCEGRLDTDECTLTVSDITWANGASTIHTPFDTRQTMLHDVVHIRRMHDDGSLNPFHINIADWQIHDGRDSLSRCIDQASNHVLVCGEVSRFVFLPGSISDGSYGPGHSTSDSGSGRTCT